jgi:hypothetical protein
MLHHLAVENFLCFGVRTHLELANAPAITLIVGENASGKSSLCKTLACVRNLVLGGNRPGQPLPIFPNLFAPPGPTRIELKVRQDDALYTYGLAATQKHIEEEWLRMQPIAGAKESHGDGPTQTLFHRRRTADAPLSVELGALPADERKRLDLVIYGTRPDQLLLNEGLRRGVRSFAPLGTWLRDRLQMILPEAKLVGLAARATREPHFAAFLGELLAESGTGVVKVEVKREPVDPSSFESEEEQRELVTALTRFPDAFAETEDGELIAEKKGPRIEVYRVKLAFTLQASDGRLASLPPSGLSDGMLRILHLAPLFYSTAPVDKPPEDAAPVFFLDDLDRGLGKTLIQSLLARFYDLGAAGRQLIATAHDTTLLAEKASLLSPQIHMIERGKDGARIRPLDA